MVTSHQRVNNKKNKVMLAIVEYIKKYGLDAVTTNLKLKLKTYENKLHLKYDQLESDMSLKEVQECRGLILDRHTLEVISMSFFKFFNEGETNAAKIDWDTASVFEKVDGCLDEDTLITTSESVKTIKEICEKKLNCKVLSYDVNSNEIVFDDIIEWSIKDNIDDWYEIILNDETLIKLTGNHKVWLPMLNCYRQVSDLTEADEFLLVTKKI
jgi:hypothetical protein